MMRMTHMLLSSFDWAFHREDGYDDFLRTLRREKSPMNDAMLDGVKFEGMVSEANKGHRPDLAHEWYEGIMLTAQILYGSAEQVYAERPIQVDGQEFLLVGVADNVKAGVIYDTKLSRRYEYGNYADSSQHSSYFYLFPGAVCFKYLVFTGKELCREVYRPFDTPPIQRYIHEFISYIAKHEKLSNIYKMNWEAK